MAGRGRGRGRGKPHVEKDAYLNMSLDDLIKGRGPSLPPLGGADTTDASPAATKYSVDVKGTLGARNTQGQMRDYKEDVFKSLDQVVDERGILKPPGKYKSHSDDDLPITGKNANLRRNGMTGRKLELDTAGLDPRGHSLDDYIQRAQAESKGRNPKLDPMANDDLPISDKNASLRRNEISGRKLQLDTTGLDPRGHSLDDYIQRAQAESKGRNPKLDPMANSLDDIIEERDIGSRGGINGAARKKRFRDDDGQRGDGDGNRSGGGRHKRLSLTPKLVLTPYRAVSFLQNKGMMVFLKLGKKVAETKEDEDPLRKWRCIVECGNVRGVCDCVRKTVAREVASDGFMKSLKEVYPAGNIPHYEMIEEMLLDPQVIEKVAKLATEAQTNLSYEFSMDLQNAEDETAEPVKAITCIYYVGDKEFIGRHSQKQYAQLIAAGKVHEFLAGEPFPKTVYFANEKCDLSVEYDFTESEIHQMAELVENDGTDLRQSVSMCSSMLKGASI